MEQAERRLAQTMPAAAGQEFSAVSRTSYPPSPSPRFAAARREIAQAITKERIKRGLDVSGALAKAAKNATPRPGNERTPRPDRGPLLPLRPDLVSSGALVFHSQSDPQRKRGLKNMLAQRRPTGAEHDLQEADMPSLAHAHAAAITESMQAGRWALAAALAERVQELHGEDASSYHGEKGQTDVQGIARLTLEKMAPWQCPASAHLVRQPWPDALPGRPRAAPTSTRPLTKLSMAWSACSEGATLAFGRSTVARGWERGLVLRPFRDGEERSAEEEPADGVLLRFRQRWSQATAIGPAEAIEDMGAQGRRFSVTAEIGREACEEFEHDFPRVGAASQLPEDGKRQQLHLGFTAVAPVKDDMAFQDVEENSWFMSTAGHVFAGAELNCIVPISWPRMASPFVPPTRRDPRVRIELCVTETGSLRLTADGKLAAVSPDDIVPRPLARDLGELFPIVVLGPNSMSVTLRPPVGPRGDAALRSPLWSRKRNGFGMHYKPT